MPRKSGVQISLDEVVLAAARVLARDGYDRLTMRAVAAEIGVKAASLYWHVESKEALSLLLFDHLIDNLEFGAPTGDWRADWRGMAERLRAQLVSIRDITRLFPDNYAAGPRAVRSLERGLGLLRDAGLPAAEAMHAYGAALSFVVGWSRFEVTRRASASAGDADPPANIEALPNLTWALAGGGVNPGGDERFRYGVELLIAGLERRLAASGT